MGLTYDSGDSTALTGALSANLTAAAAVLDATESACLKLGDALGSGELSGKGYSAVDTLFAQIVRPSIADAKEEIASIQADLETYTWADGLVAPYGMLKEDELNVQLAATRAQRDATERQIEANRTAAAASATLPAVGLALEAANTQLELVLAQLVTDVRELEDRLRALQEFAARTAELFVDGLTNLAAATGETVSLLESLRGSLVLGSVGTGVGAAVTRSVILDHLAGNKVRRDSDGRLKYGGRYLYKPASTHLYGRGRDFNEATKTRIDHYQRPIKAGGLAFVRAPVDDFTGWKDASKLGRVGMGLGVAGKVLTIGSNAERYLTGDVSARDWRDFTTDTAVDLGSAAVAAGVGAAVGSVFLPPLGTVAGAVVGIVLNGIFSEFKLGDKSAVDWAKEGARNLADGAENLWNTIAAKFW